MIGPSKQWLPALFLCIVSVQSNILIERDATSCNGTSYTTPNDLTFDLYCNTNIDSTAGDFSPPVYYTDDDVYACINRCSEFRICYGVTYAVSTKNCTLKGSGFTSALNSTSPDVGHTHSAAVSPITQLTNGYDTDCGYINGSTHTTYNDMPFTVICGMDIASADYCPTGNSSCPSHATSFQGCIDLCAQSHPLCWGVSYNPDLKAGWANCYLKDGRAAQLTPSSYAPDSEESYVIHSAQFFVTNGTDVPYDCTSGPVGNGTYNFVVYCNTGQQGNNIWALHADSLQECYAACFVYDGCIAVGYDPSLANGWEN
ncbi:uncharacterized protein PV09_09117 [Verruconis gallopava]|uniref:Apple domain-containing protein n=1 Tax=Verruconis gallopava TaxID=253628 RepID=A0A0D1ZXH7_9PEZI|nr:uncharacterized protein PV09_09117 [Verruconis gallopava]KIV99162.1 hypothetical protein PV09_09117 [Verruconis gallopava]